MAPATGLEPVTYWLTANRSTTELRRNTPGIVAYRVASVKIAGYSVIGVFSGSSKR